MFAGLYTALFSKGSLSSVACLWFNFLHSWDRPLPNLACKSIKLIRNANSEFRFNAKNVGTVRVYVNYRYSSFSHLSLGPSPLKRLLENL